MPPKERFWIISQILRTPNTDYVTPVPSLAKPLLCPGSKPTDVGMDGKVATDAPQKLLNFNSQSGFGWLSTVNDVSCTPKIADWLLLRSQGGSLCEVHRLEAPPPRITVFRHSAGVLGVKFAVLHRPGSSNRNARSPASRHTSGWVRMDKVDVMSVHLVLTHKTMKPRENHEKDITLCKRIPAPFCQYSLDASSFYRFLVGPSNTRFHSSFRISLGVIFSEKRGYFQDEEDLKGDGVKDDEEEDDDNNSTTQAQDSTYSPTDEEQEVGGESKKCFSYQNSPASHLCNQDGENESLLSDASDQMTDVKGSSSKDAQDQKNNIIPKLQMEAQDCMDKMKTAYANILTDSYWTSLGLSLKMPHTERKSCDGRNGGNKSDFDWHQDALSKSLQQNLPSKSISKPNLFSSVQLYRQNSKMYGTVFTGASRFRCRQCSAAYDTLVELTVHMNETGHYQDDNRKKDKHRPANYSKPRKRAFQDMDKEDAQKVLKCMFCGDSFDSLQDLSVHMIKTKHYQKVPLKEPIPAISSKMVASAKKRVFEVNRPCSPDSTTGSFVDHCSAPKNSNSQVSSNNRYGYQNGASYTWQFEACKSQILKCMECGSSQDTLQQLTTHMMVTGHFLKVTNSASKKGKQLVLDPLAIEKMQSLSESPSSDSQSKTGNSPACSIPEIKIIKEVKMDNPEDTSKDEKTDTSNEHEDVLEKPLDPTLKYQYLREEDLEDGSKEGGDILKSLENTVTSAINKAQNGTPSWSAYPSIHAAYQISEVLKPSLSLGSQVMQMRPSFSNKFRPIAPKSKSVPLASNTPHESPSTHVKDEVDDLESLTASTTKEIIQSETTSGCKNEESPKHESFSESPRKESSSPKEEDKVKLNCEKELVKIHEQIDNDCSTLRSSANHSPDLPCVNPLSALQSVLNNHLGKASESFRSTTSSNSSTSIINMFQKPTVSKTDKPVACLTPPRQTSHYLFESSDQPIDLTKSKSKKVESAKAQSCTSPPQKHALSDIADMVKILPKATTPKHVVSPRLASMKMEIDSKRFEDVSMEVSSLHKRKGRQSNWNPQHLLILQAQFASSLFQTSEGKYLLSDLGPQERMQISKFTGLSMTTISHWLANVKYQLRKTGGTKFLKNMDKGHPIFYCSDCASQFRTPSSYISHLETHLGFQMKDMNRLAVEKQTKVEKEISRVAVQKSPQPTATEEESDCKSDCKFKCKLCCRTFASKHAVKLHLSKTHSKSPEHHSQFVAEVDEE
ncbi:teashirt homolog 2 [Pelodytes ibericus]